MPPEAAIEMREITKAMILSTNGQCYPKLN
jgi:hypothetical protein